MTPPVTYTLIAYRRDGTRSYRGCVMETWCSDLVHEECLSRERLVARVAELRSFEGQNEYDEIYWFEDRYVLSDEWDEYELVRQDPTIESEANSLVAGLRAAHAEAERREKEAARLRHEEAVRAKELQELERLKAKWERPTGENR